MITEHDLQEAIAECEGQRNPNANTCIKLAAFYTIREHMFEKNKNAESCINMQYSYADKSQSYTDQNIINYMSDTEFAKVIAGRTQEEIMPVLDELMTTLKIINPRLYGGVMRRLEE